MAVNFKRAVGRLLNRQAITGSVNTHMAICHYRHPVCFDDFTLQNRGVDMVSIMTSRNGNGMRLHGIDWIDID